MKLPKPINKIVTLVANSVSQTSGKDIDKSFSMAQGIDELSRQAAAESIVLLKNEGILPLKKEERTTSGVTPATESEKIRHTTRAAAMAHALISTPCQNGSLSLFTR